VTDLEFMILLGVLRVAETVDGFTITPKPAALQLGRVGSDTVQFHQSSE
jgi:hypothetical protein